MDFTVKLDGESGEVFDNVGRYWRLVTKLIYLIVTRLDITYAIGVVSRFMHAPCKPHWEAVFHILWCLKGASDK